jgi:peptidoglycan-associated lipoprotein
MAARQELLLAEYVLEEDGAASVLAAPPPPGGSVMRRVSLLAALVFVALLTACPSPPKNGECKSSKDCEAQAGFGTICVSGRCAECAADTDCKDGFACKANRCEPKPAPVVAAPAPRPECVGDGDCGSGRGCQAGKCVSTQDPACADPAAFTAFFGFDQSAIGGDSTAALQKLAGCLSKAPARRVQVAGHCDDRGTTQYNLALGKKRAEAVKRYLTDLGVAGVIETTTFGKEQPVCREATESCWARNRRAESKVER